MKMPTSTLLLHVATRDSRSLIHEQLFFSFFSTFGEGVISSNAVVRASARAQARVLLFLVYLVATLLSLRV